jgi:ubiquitin carboxyl-terminal hydrolase 25/28
MSYYFECIADLARGRQSEELNMVVATLSSRGCIAKSEVDGAYRYFNIDPAHSMHINDEHVVGTYKSYLADVSPSLAEEARRQLRIISDARDSAVIRAEANNDSLETYEQALSWLDMTADQSDDFIETMVTLKVAPLLMTSMSIY